MRAGAVPVLLLHSVDTACSQAYARWMVGPSALAAHLDALLAEGFTPVSLRDVEEAAADHRRPLPPRPFAVTVDDGLADFRNALPLLESRDVPVTLFVTTRYLGATSRWLAGLGEGDRPMLDAEAVAELSARGVHMGSHAHSHAMLDCLSPALCRRELDTGRTELSAIIDQPVEHVAYPHGYADARVRRLAAAVGFRHGVGVHDRLRTVADDPMSTARVIVGSELSPEDLVALSLGRRRARPPTGRVARAAWRAYRRRRHGRAQRGMAGAS